VAISPWYPAISVFFSKDFFANDPGVGFSTTSRIDYSNDLDYWIDDIFYDFKGLTVEQLGNFDLRIGWFHFQPQFGLGFTFGPIGSESGADIWKGYWNIVLGANVIIYDRAVLSFQMRAMMINDSRIRGDGGLYLGYKF